jgi:hypothetical protein
VDRERERADHGAENSEHVPVEGGTSEDQEGLG